MAFRIPARFILVGFILYSSSLSARALYAQAPAQKQKESVPSPQELYQRLSASVFIVESLDAAGTVVAKGSAVAVTPGEVVTNRHVIEDGVSWRLKRGDHSWPATITHLDPDHDLCQLKAEGLAAPPATVRSSETLAVGERVYAIGSPEGLELTLSEGLISGLREYEKAHIIQTSAAISPGSSGGGLFDVQGRLIGITTFYLKEGQNLNFALPGEWLLALASRPVSPVEKTKIASPTSQALSWFELASQMLFAGKNEKAVSAFREVVRLEPDNAYAWNDLGLAYEALCQYNQAMHAYQEAIRLKPEDTTAWNNLGMLYNHLRQYDQAMHALQEAIRLKPEDASAWSNLGIVYSDLHQYDQAIRAYQEGIRLKPEDASAWYNLGLVYSDLLQYEQAVRAYQEAIRLKPGFASVWGGVCLAYINLRQYERAVHACQEANRLNPEDADAWYNLGTTYFYIQQYEEAVRAYQGAIRLKPEDAPTWDGLGTAYRGLHQYDQAIQAHQEALRLKPGYAEALYNLGVAYAQKGDRTKVTQVYEKLKQLNSELADQFFRKVVLP
jgi:tetratricopeptide (TPR) repeat protein